MNGARVYRIPYSVEMHEKIIQVVEKIMAGQIVIGSMKSSDIPDEFMLEGDAGTSGRNSDDMNFYALPPVGALKKQHGN